MSLVAALMGTMTLQGDQVILCGDLVLRAAGAAAQQVLEALMYTPQKYEFQNEFARKYWSKDREEGRIAAMAEAVIEVLIKRGVPITDDESAALLASSDLPTIEHWLDRAFTATSVRELLGDPSAVSEN